MTSEGINTAWDARQNHDERDLAFSRMSKKLSDWLMYSSPVVFHAQSCLKMEREYGTEQTIDILRSIVTEQTIELYGKTYPLIVDVHYERNDVFHDPTQVNIWDQFTR